MDARNALQLQVSPRGACGLEADALLLHRGWSVGCGVAAAAVFKRVVLGETDFLLLLSEFLDICTVRILFAGHSCRKTRGLAGAVRSGVPSRANDGRFPEHASRG